ncbi:MAG: outer membrane beta-barrel protein [Hyphomicrobiaceae bacterium]
MAVAVVLVVVLAVPAAAQQGDDRIGITRSVTTSPPSVPSVGRPQPDYPFDDEPDRTIPPPIPRDDPAADAEEFDPLDAERPAAGQRPALRDGDLDVREPAPLRDGIVDLREPEAVRDGVDPLVVDTREPDDIAAFENPPAGYDPLLFQIEDIDPVADRRIDRLARFEPFDPVGVRIGSFVLFPELETGASYYSNVLRSPNARSDTAADVRPSGRLVSDWKRHALELRGTAVLSFHNENDSEDDRAYALEARGRLDVTSRTNIQARMAHDVAQESRSAIDANTTGERATLTRDTLAVAAQHRFNRLTVQLRGSLDDYSYSDVDVGGVTQSNAQRDYTEYKQAVRATWEFKPTISGFTEVEVNQRRYDTVASSDGIGRDSDGERYRVGVSFGSSGQKLRGEAAIGYGRQAPRDKRLEDIDGILVDANLAWRMTDLTTLSFNARTDVSETQTAGSGGVLTRAAGVELRHAFRTYLIGTAGFTYTNQDYIGVAIDENELRADLGLEYFLSREAVLFGRYRHTMFDSSSPGASYNSDEVHVGVRLRR